MQSELLKHPQGQDVKQHSEKFICNTLSGSWVLKNSYVKCTHNHYLMTETVAQSSALPVGNRAVVNNLQRSGKKLTIICKIQIMSMFSNFIVRPCMHTALTRFFISWFMPSCVSFSVSLFVAL